MKIFTDNLITRNIVQPIWKKLDGKKTAIGATSFLLWVSIYAMPAFGDYNGLVKAGTMIRDFLIANGIELDNTAFNTGTIMSILGLLDKYRKSRR